MDRSPGAPETRRGEVGGCPTDQLTDLTTVNDIVATLNQATDVRAALDGALARIVALMGLASGMIYLREDVDGSRGIAGSLQARSPPWSATCAAGYGTRRVGQVVAGARRCARRVSSIARSMW